MNLINAQPVVNKYEPKKRDKKEIQMVDPEDQRPVSKSESTLLKEKIEALGMEFNAKRVDVTSLI